MDIHGIHMANLKDIAARTGLSINTVSRALRGSGYVSAEAQDKVRAAADELGYAPNRAARSLRFNRNFEIAVLVFISRTNARGDSQTMDKLIGIKEQVASSGYEINLQFIYYEYHYSPEDNSRLMSILRQKPAGVIIIGDAPQQLAMASECMARKVPVTLISYSEQRDFNCVYIDRAQGICDAVDYLYAKGRRTIVYAQLNTCQNRLRGYREGIRKHHLEEHIVSPDRVYTLNDDLFRVGLRLAASILTEIPHADAVQGYSDYLSAGVLAGLIRSGRRVPADISVIGFDDRELAAFTSPPMTTLAQPGFDAGKLAVDLLLNQIESGTQTLKAVKVPMNLVIRQST
jgi:DNA-binding LacI/PurR family transcriptional regulator